MTQKRDPNDCRACRLLAYCECSIEDIYDRDYTIEEAKELFGLTDADIERIRRYSWIIDN